MDAHVHSVAATHVQTVTPDRRRRDRAAPAFEIEKTAGADTPPVADAPAPPARAANEEGVGVTVDVVA